MEFTLSDFLATCETQGCENETLQIPVKVLADAPSVICGACGLVITNIRPEEEIGAL